MATNSGRRKPRVDYIEKDHDSLEEEKHMVLDSDHPDTSESEEDDTGFDLEQ